MQKEPAQMYELAPFGCKSNDLPDGRGVSNLVAVQPVK